MRKFPASIYFGLYRDVAGNIPIYVFLYKSLLSFGGLPDAAKPPGHGNKPARAAIPVVQRRAGRRLPAKRRCFHDLDSLIK
nr:hypothetical protein [uncultured Rhodopila sp.]